VIYGSGTVPPMRSLVARSLGAIAIVVENDVFTGGTISGNACWEIGSSDAASPVLYDAPPSIVPMRLFFALR
jgi:hypothetical protein